MYDHETVISQLRSMVDWAIETGYHECGYDPVDAVKVEIERLRSLILQAYNAGQVNDGFMRLALRVEETALN